MNSVPTPTGFRAFRAVWLVGVLGVVISGALAGWFALEARRQDAARFTQTMQQWVYYLDAYTEKIEGMLRNLARELSAQTEPTTTVWDEFMEQTSPTWNFEGVVAIGYATNQLTPTVLETLAPWLSAAPPRDRGEVFRLQPPLDQPRRWNAWRMEVYREGVRPTAPFEQAERTTSNSGKDFKSARFAMAPGAAIFAATVPFAMQMTTQQRLEASFQDFSADYVQDAATREEVKISPYDTLLQWTNGNRLPGVAMIVPVTHPRRREILEKLKPDHLEQNWLNWQLNAGMVFALLDYDTLARNIEGALSSDVEVQIYASDQTPLTEKTRLTHRPETIRPAGNGQRPTTRDQVHRWRMYGQQWSLVFHPTPAFDQHSTRDRAWWAGGLGLLTTGLFCWTLATQMHGRRREARRAAELREARDALQAAQSERERLSHDLHDGVIQSLYAIQLGFTHVERTVAEVAPATAHQLAEGRANLEGVISELRGVISEPKRAGERKPVPGLAVVLESLVQRLRSAATATIELDCDGAAANRLTPAQALQLTALAREALSNSLRHAHAQNIKLRLMADGARVILEIADDGAGFDLARPLPAGIGLRTMRQRAEGLGAILDLQTAPGRGTRIRVAVSIPATLERETDDE